MDRFLVAYCPSPLTRRGARVIGTDTLGISLLLNVSSDDQEREQGGEDDPNVKAHQGSPGAVERL